MIFKKKVVTPDMVDWHQNPQDLILLDAHLETLAANHLAERVLVVMVGGALDSFYRPMLNGVFVPYRLKYGDKQDIAYATHACRKQIKQLVDQWAQAGQKICLVGHSWGGKTVIDVARDIASQIEIELLVTLDPVSRRLFRRSPDKPDNVLKWINIHVDYGLASMEYSNTVARMGGYWGHCFYADQNIKLTRDGAQEITHAMAGRMFREVEVYVSSL